MRAREVETGMALRDRGRRQRSGDEDMVVRPAVLLTQPAQALRERMIDGAQRALAQQGIEQAHAVASIGSSTPCANSASSRSISSRGGCQACTPGDVASPASSPRQNRYRMPPKCVS